MKQYLELGKHILENGVEKEDRTGTGTLSIFGYILRFRLQDGFPLVTTKDMSGIRFDGIVEELLWFLDGDTNIKTLVDKGINIWNRDAYKNYLQRTREHTPLTYQQFVEQIKNGELFHQYHGDMGPIYGKQWRAWDTARGVTVDQIAQTQEQLRKNPDDRGILVTAWNPGDLPFMGLRPCHDSHQFYVANNTLSCMLRMRSSDFFLGLPYNIASYALYTMKMAQSTGFAPGELIVALGDAHIYNNHIPQVKELLTRTPHELPTVYLNPFIKDIFDFKREDIELTGYTAHPALKGEQSF